MKSKLELTRSRLVKLLWAACFLLLQVATASGKEEYVALGRVAGECTLDLPAILFPDSLKVVAFLPQPTGYESPLEGKVSRLFLDCGVQVIPSRIVLEAVARNPSTEDLAHGLRVHWFLIADVAGLNNVNLELLDGCGRVAYQELIEAGDLERRVPLLFGKSQAFPLGGKLIIPKSSPVLGMAKELHAAHKYPELMELLATREPAAKPDERICLLSSMAALAFVQRDFDDAISYAVQESTLYADYIRGKETSLNPLPRLFGPAALGAEADMFAPIRARQMRDKLSTYGGHTLGVFSSASEDRPNLLVAKVSSSHDLRASELKQLDLAGVVVDCLWSQANVYDLRQRWHYITSSPMGISQGPPKCITGPRTFYLSIELNGSLRDTLETILPGGQIIVGGIVYTLDARWEITDSTGRQLVESRSRGMREVILAGEAGNWESLRNVALTDARDRLCDLVDVSIVTGNPGE